jgi:hypothetical protein
MTKKQQDLIDELTAKFSELKELVDNTKEAIAVVGCRKIPE